MMKKVTLKKVSATIVLVFIMFQIFAGFSVNTPIVNAISKTISVPDDYSTITQAIDNAAEYSTIIVKEGIYEENPTINKSLNLIAQGNVTVIGEGGVERGAKAVFTINANKVTLSGFTIKSQNYSQKSIYATGITLNGDSSNIHGNTITETYYGIFCYIQSDCNITANTITNTKKDGIRIIGGSKNTISNNTLTGNDQSGIAINGYSNTMIQNTITKNNRGIGLGSSYSVVTGNILTDNTESGLYIATSNSTINHNLISGNGWGVYFTSFFAAPNNNTFFFNNFVANTKQVGADSPYNTQIWSNHSLEVGNYWSTYNGDDYNADGIGDLPYTMYANNVDNQPLITPVNLDSPLLLQLPNAPSTVNGLAGMWSFEEVKPNGISPDALGVNPVMLEPSGDSYTPVLVNGKIGSALKFNGTDYAYVIASPNLDVVDEITIEAWVYVEEFKEVSYSNVVVECERTPDKYPDRILGFAYCGESPQNNSSPLQGALRGFITTEDGQFHEIVTTQAVVPLNEWIYVVFVRSITDGMHIYVNGVEQSVSVTSGSAYPTGNVARGNEFYIGHDSVCLIDEVSISTIAITQTQVLSSPIWTQWWFLAIIGIVVVLVSFTFLAKRIVKSKKH